MSAFKFIIGIAAIVFITIVWIVLNEGVIEVGSVMNEMVTNNVTGPDIIIRNNMMVSMFFYSLFFLIMVVSIWILKTTVDEGGGAV